MIAVISTGLDVPKEKAQRCLDSVQEQRGVDVFQHHVFSAVSGEEEGDAICIRRRGRSKCLEAWPGFDRGHVLNLCGLVRALDLQTIVVWLDLDDALAHPDVLRDVERVHQGYGLWVTYGSYRRSDDGRHVRCLPYERSPRSEPWQASHLRTFRAGLFRSVRDSDLRGEDGAYFDLAVDQAFMIPMIELAGLGRTLAVPEVRCLYSVETSVEANGDAKTKARERRAVETIRKKAPSEPLVHAPW